MADEGARSFIGRIVSRMLRSRDMRGLEQAIAALTGDAHRRGLTDSIIDEELAGYNAERRDQTPPAA